MVAVMPKILSNTKLTATPPPKLVQLFNETLVSDVSLLKQLLPTVVAIGKFTVVRYEQKENAN